MKFSETLIKRRYRDEHFIDLQKACALFKQLVGEAK